MAIVRIVNLVFIAEKIKSEEAISTATGTATVTATAVRATTTGSASSYPTGTATRAVLVPHHATALPPQPQGARHTALICRRLGTEGVSYEALRADDPDTDTDAQDRAAATATGAEGGVELQTFDSAV